MKPFECQQCGECCRNIIINIGYSDIIKWLETERYDILDEISYIENAKAGRGFYFVKTIRKPKQACPFLKENKCSIYNDRPQACKDFPHGHAIWKRCPAWEDIKYRIDILESGEASNRQAADYNGAEAKKHLLIHFLFLARDRKTAEIKKLLDPLDPDETLYCDSFDNTTREWTETGANPYLNDSTANYIDSAAKKAEHAWFGFANTTHSGDTLNSVTLYLEGSGNGTDTQDIFLHDGTSESTAFGFIFGAMGWQNVDVSAFLDTWAKVDACTMRIVHENAANACTIRRAYLFCNYTAAAQEYTKDFTTDAILIKRGTIDFLTDALLIKRGTKDFLTDALLLKRFTKDFTVDAFLRYIQTKDFTADAILLKRQTIDFTTDAILIKRAIKDFTVDAILTRSGTKDFLVDAMLLKRQIKDFLVDAILLKTQTIDFLCDAILTKVGMIDFLVDAMLIKRGTKDFTTDAILLKAQTIDFSADAFLTKTYTKDFSVDAMLLQRSKIEVTADAMLIKRATKDFLVDAILTLIGTKDFSTDAIILKRQVKTFTCDAILRLETAPPPPVRPPTRHPTVSVSVSV